ncbi:MAG TPA: hypothetical protein VD840_07505, partial [Sinorhizobium sp.]|nr:hypothetical protein [Sinorhizobium sp.]
GHPSIILSGSIDQAFEIAVEQAPFRCRLAICAGYMTARIPPVNRAKRNFSEILHRQSRPGFSETISNRGRSSL